MNGMKSLSVRTVFPISMLRAESLAGTSKSKRSQSIGVVAKPLYETESAVTSAIISGTIVGLSSVAYAEAKRYQLYLKAAKKIAA